MEKLTKRQAGIVEYIRKNGSTGNREIKQYIENYFGAVSRITVIRELEVLLTSGLIKKEGDGRSVKYAESLTNKLLAYADPDIYFKKGPDERTVAFERFNFEVFRNLQGIFSKEEISELVKINSEYQKRIKKLPPAIIKKEIERLTTELSWKSSQIEGNTYTLVDTEILLKEHKEAKGHKKAEAIMILNHKAALDYIFSRTDDFKEISLRKVENIHSLLVGGLGVSRGLRKNVVGIIGTKYRPLDNEHQIREAMEKALKAINSLKDPFSKSLAAMLFIPYIQPFEDGNKRTSRLLGNALLAAHNVCPLSFRSINEGDYKKAVILFYEQNSARFFKELFVKQFRFSVENYFRG
ncbi:MAG: Fic family protein [Candidatus Shapirobacteria bacterium]